MLINSNHWVLVAFFPLIKTVIYYDSRHNEGKTVREEVLNFFKSRFHKETGSASSDSEWKSVDEPDVPYQSNSFDCGVFVCQMAERLSRRSPFNFNQSQMPAIRIQMIEQIVAGEILLPPSDPVGLPHKNRIGSTNPHRNKFFVLRTNSVNYEEIHAKGVRAGEMKSDAGNLLEETIKAIQNKSNDEIHRLQTELAAANRKIELISAVGETMQKTKNERIDRIEVDHKQQIDKLKQDADKVLNERLNALQSDNEKEIQKLLDERKELLSKLSPPLVTESVTQTDEFPQPNASNLAEVDTQTEEEWPDSAPPMPDEFPDDSEEAFTRPKTPQTDDSSSDNSDPDYNQPPSKQRKLSSSQNFKPLSQSENDEELPVCKSAQLPPPPPAPINFGDAVVVTGKVKKGDTSVYIHRPSEEVTLPIIQNPGPDFSRWLHNHGINTDYTKMTSFTRDLELRRRFLMQGDLTPEEQQFIVDRVPPVYENSPNYLRALAGYALSQFDSEQAFALLYCFSRLTNKALRKLFAKL